MDARGRLTALGRPAVRLLVAVSVAAAALSATAIAFDPQPVIPLAILIVAAGIAAGEGFRVDLPYRRGGNASFTLGDAALAAALLVLPATEVVLGAALGIFAWQLAERVSVLKLVFNVAQYVAGAAAAALVVQALAPRPAAADPAALAAVAIGIGLFLAVNVSTVSGMIALTSGQSWRRTAGRITPTAILLAAGNTGLGLLGVLLAGSHPWALPAILVPLVLLYGSSRQEVRAQVDRERSAAFVSTEQRLGHASSPEQVSEILVDGVRQILGCQAAVWRDGHWETPVPDGSAPCPVEPGLEVALVTRGPALGPAVTEPCMAIGAGEGVLVAWPGELGITRESEDWLERLGRSGRASFDRAIAHVALRQERATLRTVVDGTADGIFVTDNGGAIRLWNPAMAQLAGIGPRQALGHAVSDVLAPGPWATEGVHDVTLPGTEHVWRVSVAVVSGTHAFGDNGSTDLRIVLVHDVTAERRLARMKDDMMAVVSHELRTPLTPIKASAQLLRRRWEGIAEHHRVSLLSSIEERADHLAHLIEDLLLAGEVSDAPDALPVHLVSVDVAATVRDEVEQLALTYPGHKLTFSGPDRLETFCDPARVRQMIGNLVDNACKFSPTGSPVQIRVAAEEGHAVVTVADHGRGIPTEDLERIFDRFERVEDPLHMTTGGAGLGLYIVRALASALGGEVRLDSEPGQGTTAVLRLPLRVAAA